jgi:hypothetical protein
MPPYSLSSTSGIVLGLIGGFLGLPDPPPAHELLGSHSFAAEHLTTNV